MCRLVLAALAVCLAFGNAIAADAGNAAAPALKIGVVDMQKLAQESDFAKDSAKQMEEKFGKQRQDLEKQGESLKKKAETLKNPKVSEEKKLAFIRSKQELDQKTRDFLRKVEQEQVKVRQELVERVFNAAYRVAQAKGFNFVVDITGGGVLYADKAMDLTTDVMEELNRIPSESGNNEEKNAKPAAPGEKKN